MYVTNDANTYVKAVSNLYKVNCNESVIADLKLFVLCMISTTNGLG